MHLKKLTKQERTKPIISGRKEVIMIGAEVSEIETRKIIEKTSKLILVSLKNKKLTDL